jgi:hypothetical protein
MGDRTRDDVSTPDTGSPFDRNGKPATRDRGDERRRTREGEGLRGGDEPAAAPSESGDGGNGDFDAW